MARNRWIDGSTSFGDWKMNVFGENEKGTLKHSNQVYIRNVHMNHINQICVAGRNTGLSNFFDYRQ